MVSWEYFSIALNEEPPRRVAAAASVRLTPLEKENRPLSEVLHEGRSRNVLQRVRQETEGSDEHNPSGEDSEHDPGMCGSLDPRKNLVLVLFHFVYPQSHPIKTDL